MGIMLLTFIGVVVGTAALTKFFEKLAPKILDKMPEWMADALKEPEDWNC